MDDTLSLFLRLFGFWIKIRAFKTINISVRTKNNSTKELRNYEFNEKWTFKLSILSFRVLTFNGKFWK